MYIVSVSKCYDKYFLRYKPFCTPILIPPFHFSNGVGDKKKKSILLVQYYLCFILYVEWESGCYPLGYNHISRYCLHNHYCTFSTLKQATVKISLTLWSSSFCPETLHILPMWRAVYSYSVSLTRYPTSERLNTQYTSHYEHTSEAVFSILYPSLIWSVWHDLTSNHQVGNAIVSTADDSWFYGASWQLHITVPCFCAETLVYWHIIGYAVFLFCYIVEQHPFLHLHLDTSLSFDMEIHSLYSW